MPRDAVVLSGSIAQRPGRPGHAWVFLQYLLGFRSLGFDVHFVDRWSDEAGAAWLADVMAAVGLDDCWTVLTPDGAAVGAPRAVALERLRSAAFLLNVMGFLDDEELLGAASRRVFLDIDPGFGQMWHALGLADVFAGHDVFATVGTCVGTDSSLVPTAGRDWVRTVPPVALEHWPALPPGGGAFTSVASWRGPFGPIDYHGRSYGLRVHEFRRFLSLPSLCAAPFVVALDIDPADTADRVRLETDGWTLVDPARVGTLDAYRDFIAGSAAELCIAKNLYVDTRGGWFSDRSACYLASGRPVIMQDTGVDLPRGDGLLTFTTVEEAAAAVDAVLSHPQRQSAAARELAQTHLSAAVVLPALVDAVTA